MNIDWYVTALLYAGILSFFTWVVSLVKKDVSIVDSVWSLMMLVMVSVYFYNAETGFREILIYLLMLMWALRLAAHITLRSWGESEDRRYQEIRNKYSPNFEIKSLFYIFVFQLLLASVITLPMGFVLESEQPLSWFDVIAVILIASGFVFESIADYQLYQFKKDKNNQGKVMRQGLWAYSRHPNYFGETVVWWGVYSLVMTTGPWYLLISPLLMTYLLLKFSGVGLMEEGIEERRPEYIEYRLTTNAFIPGPRKQINNAGNV